MIGELQLWLTNDRNYRTVWYLSCTRNCCVYWGWGKPCSWICLRVYIFVKETTLDHSGDFYLVVVFALRKLYSPYIFQQLHHN